MIKVLDWDKAARIINTKGYNNVSAGISEDWFFTGADILEDGKIVDREVCRCWIHSSWGTPVIRVYGCNDEGSSHIEHQCFREANDDYTPEYWPESAKKILEEKEEI